MTEPFTVEYQAQWRDMDFNQHMGNSAFLDYASNTRTEFSAARGFSVERWAELRFGPVVLEDRLSYRREIRLLERFTVDLEMAALASDGRKFKIRNTFRAEDGTVCAIVESAGLWFDLDARKPTVPTPELRAAWESAPHAADFESWD